MYPFYPGPSQIAYKDRESVLKLKGFEELNEQKAAAYITTPALFSLLYTNTSLSPIKNKLSTKFLRA